MTQIVPGELLPWKGEWFEVTDVDGKKVVLQQRGKRTTGAVKRDEARKRWLEQHPNAKEIR
jgi:hypothetical protein